MGAPVSAVLQLELATLAQVPDALAKWLYGTYKVALESAEHEHLIVEWRVSQDPGHFACRLMVSDSQTRRTVTILSDELGAVAIVEEAPLTAADGSHRIFDLSERLQLLLIALAPTTQGLAGLRRGRLNTLETVDPDTLLHELHAELAPGLIVAVTPNHDDEFSSEQYDLMQQLMGLAIVGALPIAADLLDRFELPATLRPGSLINIARTPNGLDARVIASASLRTKPESARRLIVRRQLSTPIPFNLERRRSAAMGRLLATGQEVDLPTALQLLDEESHRANELSNRVKELEGLLESAYDEQDAALADLDDAQSQVRYLQRAFRQLGEVPLIEPDDDEGWYPDRCIDALIAGRESLSYLIFGVTDIPCQTLDSQQKRSIWAKKIWSSLRALNDYCRHKADGRFSGDISTYRDDSPEGAIPLLADYAASESESTGNNPVLRTVRTFAVPPQVDPSGRIYMRQHLKIDRGGQSAPRIHLYDDSGGPTQRIYIGYIGPHLPTSSGF